MKGTLASLMSIWIGGAAIAVCVVARLYAAVRLHRWRREQRAPFEAPLEPLERGLRAYVGTVETDAPEGVAIRVLYGSAGEVAPHRAWGNSATEAHPFTLAISGTDARVWVDPEERYCLRVVSTEHRTSPNPQRAHLVRAGDRVLVSGLLVPARRAEGGYRGSGHDFTLRPPDGGEISITSEAFLRAAAREAGGIVTCADITWGVPALAHVALAWLDRGRERWPNALSVTAFLLAMIVIVGSLAAVRERRKRR
ncbi:MAG: hypothetical protein QM820_28940 [Minicystis sp.]